MAQARRASVLLDSPGFSAVIVATSGTVARMDTVHPATFVAVKRWMAGQPDRDPLKRRRDVLQADAVQVLVEQYLPQVQAKASNSHSKSFFEVELAASPCGALRLCRQKKAASKSGWSR